MKNFILLLCIVSLNAGMAGEPSQPVMKIETTKIWENRSGRHTSWFHPRITRTASGELLMTLQGSGGSDYFLPVNWSVSKDHGESWSEPEFIPEMGRIEIGNGITEGICDVVPELHEPSGAVLAIGHNVYYTGGRLYDSLGDWNKEKTGGRLQRYPVYAVRDAAGQWIVARQKLIVPGMKNASMYTCGSGQRVFHGDDLFIPFSYSEWGRKDRKVFSARCSFDGREIKVLERGEPLELAVKRGLLEPSMIRFGDRFLMTMRAEDGHGYHTVSGDGLKWRSFAPWAFDTGEVLRMGTSQQHWLHHRDKLYLVYNRELPYNKHLMRWRSPLIICEVETAKMVLIRKTEQIVFPVMPEGTGAEFKAALFGNFHPVRISDTESLITVGEERSHDGFRADTWQARLR